MSHLMQQALRAAWAQLPPALQAHHRSGTTLDIGPMDIECPAFMQPVLCVLSLLGALVRRREMAVHTRVEKSMACMQLAFRGVRFAANVG